MTPANHYVEMPLPFQEHYEKAISLGLKGAKVNNYMFRAMLQDMMTGFEEEIDLYVEVQEALSA